MGVITAAVVLASGFALAACRGGDELDRAGNQAATSQEKAKQVAFVIENARQNHTQEMADGFRAGAMSVDGVEHSVVTQENTDPAIQTRLFDEAVKSYPNGVSLFTMTPNDLVAPVRAAVTSKVPAVMVDNLIPASAGFKLYVGNDNRALGRLLAEQAVAKLPPDASGKVVLGLSGPGNPALERRISGMREVLEQKLPKVRVLGAFETKFDAAVNHANWERLVKENPDALAFLGAGVADAFNLADIRTSTGGKWIAGGFDLDSRSLAAVRSGQLLLVSPEHFAKGQVAGYLLAGHAKSGKPLPEGWIYTPGLAITAANVDEIIERQQSFASRQLWFASRVEEILAAPVRSLDAAAA